MQQKVLLLAEAVIAVLLVKSALMPDIAVAVRGAAEKKMEEGYYLDRKFADRMSPLDHEGMVIPRDWTVVQLEVTTGDCRTVYFKNQKGMYFSFIPAGSFMMGSPKDELARDEDERLHRVDLTSPFFMQATEVTQQQWREVMGYNPSLFSGGGRADYPVENVTWLEVQDFISRLNAGQEDVRYRLPTEAEWEYACRAGSEKEFYEGEMKKNEKGYSSALDKIGWYYRNSDKTTHPVARKKANRWGLFDMHGNVWEWCADWGGEYPVTSRVNPTGPPSGHARIRRGGAWNHYPSFCRAANRSRFDPNDSNPDTGFRLVAETVKREKEQEAEE